MSKEKRLTNAEKETIAYLHKRYPVGKIAHLVGRHRRSVSRYKNYKLPGKTKGVYTVSTQKETYDPSREQATFQMFYDECKHINQSDPHAITLFLIRGRKGDKKYRYLNKFRKLPRYENKSNQEIMNDVADITCKNYLLSRKSKS